MRTVELSRKTAETDIALKLNLDGNGNAKVDSGNGFFTTVLKILA